MNTFKAGLLQSGLKMNAVAAVIYVFGWLFAFMALAMLLPLTFALVLAEEVAAQAFFGSAIATGFLGGALIFAFKDHPKHNTRRQGLLLLGTVWFILPLVAAVPFLLVGVPDDPLKAYFEAVSGLTTTGATIFVDISELPKSIIVWRATIQWLGGLITLLTLVAILAPVIAADELERSLNQAQQTPPGAHGQFIETLPVILPVYSALTSVCFVCLLIARIPSFDAFCLALSTVSTGGFMPRSGSISLYGSPMAELVLTVFMFFGAVSILWVRFFVQFKLRYLLETREPLWIACTILIFGVFITIPLLQNSPETGLLSIYHALTLGLATAASFVSTTGFVVSDQTKDILPYTLVLIVCILGGGRMSTAGGLKFFRLAAMIGQSSRELLQLVFPHGVRQSRFSSENQNSAIMRSVWANFALMIMVLWLLTVVIAITGLPLSAALLASISAISNSGPAYALTPLPELVIPQSYAAMHPGAQAALCFGMILGRVEILALLSLLNIAYWRA